MVNILPCYRLEYWIVYSTLYITYRIADVVLFW